MKRFILLAIFLIVAFYVYKGIHPSGAEALIDRINIFQKDTEITPPSPSKIEVTEDVIETGEVVTGEGQGLFDFAEETSCAQIGEFANDQFGVPECCSGLEGFYTGQGIWTQVDPGLLCYDPAMGIPRCDIDLESGQEGWFSSGSLIYMDDCMKNETITVPTQEIKTDTKTTTTPPTTTTPKPTVNKEVQDTKNLINSLFK